VPLPSPPSRQNRDRVRTISFYAALALVTYLLYTIAKPFILPLCASAILVVFFYPWHARLEARLGAGPGALASTVLVTAMLIVPSLLVLTAFVREATVAAGTVQDAIESGGFGRLNAAWAWAQQRLPLLSHVDAQEAAAELAQRFGGAAAGLAGDILKNVGYFLFDLVVVIFATFFFFRDARPIMAMVRRVLPFEADQREQVISQAHDLIRASVVSSVAVASAQGVAGGVLFWLLGAGAPVFWGVMMAFASLLPAVGAWIIWLPAGLWLLSSGSVVKGLILLGVGAGVVSMIDNVLRPALLSGRSQMNGLVVLVSLLGGLAAFGLIGVVIGPVIVATMASLLSAYTAPAGDATAAAEDELPLGT
jgi:predicted PurR-regulated permease PerM